MPFERFGFWHWMVLASIPAGAFVLAILAARWRVLKMRVPVALGVSLLLLEAAWFVWIIRSFGWGVSYALPLQLTDATILLTACAAMTRSQALFDISYYWALTAMPAALLTPDLEGSLLSFSTIAFLAGHGLTVVVTLFLVWSGAMRPRPGSMWRSYLWVNVFAAVVLAFNFAFDSNYMYLVKKPAQPSPLDWMGPWPVYIVLGDVVALVLFAMLQWPFRSGICSDAHTGRNRAA